MLTNFVKIMTYYLTGNVFCYCLYTYIYSFVTFHLYKFSENKIMGKKMYIDVTGQQQLQHTIQITLITFNKMSFQ